MVPSKKCYSQNNIFSILSPHPCHTLSFFSPTPLPTAPFSKKWQNYELNDITLSLWHHFLGCTSSPVSLTHFFMNSSSPILSNISCNFTILSIVNLEFSRPNFLLCWVSLWANITYQLYMPKQTHKKLPKDLLSYWNTNILYWILQINFI